MTTPMSRALRVIAPSDLRLIWRDGFLLFILVALPLACLGFRWLMPYLAELVAEWVDLERYYGLVLAYVLCQQPVLLGYIVGILFIEERDEGTFLALRASLLSLPRFLGYRLLAGMGLSIGLTAIGVTLAGLVAVPALALICAAVLASLAVPLVALAYAVYLRNKLQAVASGKLVQAWAGLPAFSSSRRAPGNGSGARPFPCTSPCGCSRAPPTAAPNGG